ncbi:MAG: hypothetical protein U0842_16355 [Candidatus Binatia bacterium]
MPSMNAAQLHLALTHLPVVTALLAAATLAIGAVARNAATRRFGLALLIVAGLTAIPTQMSGEGAEEVVEDRPGVSEAMIERHEDAAGVALALTVLGGALAAGTLVAGRLGRQRAAQGLFALALAMSLADTAALAWVAHLGGEIRHDEIRAGGPAAAGGEASVAGAEADDD